jgi:hypothetical protein
MPPFSDILKPLFWTKNTLVLGWFKRSNWSILTSKNDQERGANPAQLEGQFGLTFTLISRMKLQSKNVFGIASASKPMQQNIGHAIRYAITSGCN